MTLVDCFTLLMARIQDFQRQPENASPEDLSRNLDQLIDQAQSRALRHHIDTETFQAALYPVLAWADETVSRSHRWPDEHAWQPFLLQRRYFHTGLAGREFFERLEQLGAQDHTLREVYLLCLCLGFQGRYSAAGNLSELANIRMKHYRLLPQADMHPSQADAHLFPAAYPGQGTATARRGRFRRLSLQRLLLILAPPFIVLALALIMHTRLTQAVLEFRQTINL
ncbi:DotU family type IV/VI secretion system protein [Castellaniella denitrificans]|uniref:DotU family type IV/VI secretion system protein n=1 Tax=Castellaniella denitrificans TaxID=56119 RepID=A0ABT4M3C4_9BURK|nr:DotU family type IV/VI secretion system protein [Castellaniella denitrificans]MCZ4329814.1 DotU family type IV/VI secretion system protein [Castellaniella denitrificans]